MSRGWSSAHYVEQEASTITVGTRVVLTGNDGQGTYKGLADVTDIFPGRYSLHVELWTGRRTIHRRWPDHWMIRVAVPLD